MDYWYYVSSALSADGLRESAWWLCPYCLDYGWRKLIPPSDVSASDGVYSDRIRITWTPADGATHYKVYRSTSSTSVVIKDPPVLVSPVVAGTVFDDMDAALIPKTNYYYWVKSAVNAAGDRESGLAMTGSEGWKATSAPTGVLATDGSFTDKVRVRWNTVNGLSQYQVYRNTTNNPKTAAVVSSWQGSAIFEDISAERGQIYYYWVKGRVDANDT